MARITYTHNKNRTDCHGLDVYVSLGLSYVQVHKVKSASDMCNACKYRTSLLQESFSPQGVCMVPPLAKPWNPYPQSCTLNGDVCKAYDGSNDTQVTPALYLQQSEKHYKLIAPNHPNCFSGPSLETCYTRVLVTLSLCTLSNSCSIIELAAPCDVNESLKRSLSTMLQSNQAQQLESCYTLTSLNPSKPRRQLTRDFSGVYLSESQQGIAPNEDYLRKNRFFKRLVVRRLGQQQIDSDLNYNRDIQFPSSTQTNQRKVEYPTAINKTKEISQICEVKTGKVDLHSTIAHSHIGQKSIERGHTYQYPTKESQSDKMGMLNSLSIQMVKKDEATQVYRNQLLQPKIMEGPSQENPIFRQKRCQKSYGMQQQVLLGELNGQRSQSQPSCKEQIPTIDTVVQQTVACEQQINDSTQLFKIENQLRYGKNSTTLNHVSSECHNSQLQDVNIIGTVRQSKQSSLVKSTLSSPEKSLTLLQVDQSLPLWPGPQLVSPNFDDVLLFEKQMPSSMIGLPSPSLHTANNPTASNTGKQVWKNVENTQTVHGNVGALHQFLSDQHSKSPACYTKLWVTGKLPIQPAAQKAQRNKYQLSIAQCATTSKQYNLQDMPGHSLLHNSLGESEGIQTGNKVCCRKVMDCAEETLNQKSELTQTQNQSYSTLYNKVQLDTQGVDRSSNALESCSYKHQHRTLMEKGEQCLKGDNLHQLQDVVVKGSQLLTIHLCEYVPSELTQVSVGTRLQTTSEIQKIIPRIRKSSLDSSKLNSSQDHNPSDMLLDDAFDGMDGDFFNPYIIMSTDPSPQLNTYRQESNFSAKSSLLGQHRLWEDSKVEQDIRSPQLFPMDARECIHSTYQEEQSLATNAMVDIDNILYNKNQFDCTDTGVPSIGGFTIKYNDQQEQSSTPGAQRQGGIHSSNRKFSPDTKDVQDQQILQPLSIQNNQIGLQNLQANIERAKDNITCNSAISSPNVHQTHGQNLKNTVSQVHQLLGKDVIQVAGTINNGFQDSPCLDTYLTTENVVNQTPFTQYTDLGHKQLIQRATYDIYGIQQLGNQDNNAIQDQFVNQDANCSDAVHKHDVEKDAQVVEGQSPQTNGLVEQIVKALQSRGLENIVSINVSNNSGSNTRENLQHDQPASSQVEKRQEQSHSARPLELQLPWTVDSQPKSAAKFLAHMHKFISKRLATRLDQRQVMDEIHVGDIQSQNQQNTQHQQDSVDQQLGFKVQRQHQEKQGYIDERKPSVSLDASNRHLQSMNPDSLTQNTNIQISEQDTREREFTKMAASALSPQMWQGFEEQLIKHGKRSLVSLGEVHFQRVQTLKAIIVILKTLVGYSQHCLLPYSPAFANARYKFQVQSYDETKSLLQKSQKDLLRCIQLKLNQVAEHFSKVASPQSKSPAETEQLRWLLLATLVQKSIESSHQRVVKSSSKLPSAARGWSVDNHASKTQKLSIGKARKTCLVKMQASSRHILHQCAYTLLQILRLAMGIFESVSIGVARGQLEFLRDNLWRELTYSATGGKNNRGASILIDKRLLQWNAGYNMDVFISHIEAYCNALQQIAQHNILGEDFPQVALNKIVQGMCGSTKGTSYTEMTTCTILDTSIPQTQPACCSSDMYVSQHQVDQSSMGGEVDAFKDLLKLEPQTVSTSLQTIENQFHIPSGSLDKHNEPIQEQDKLQSGIETNAKELAEYGTHLQPTDSLELYQKLYDKVEQIQSQLGSVGYEFQDQQEEYFQSLVFQGKNRFGHPISITRKDLSSLTHLSLQEAAQQLAIPVSQFKKMLKELKIVRWPQRLIKSIAKLREELPQCFAQQLNNGEDALKNNQDPVASIGLKAALDELSEVSKQASLFRIHKIDTETKGLRQASFKAQFGQKQRKLRELNGNL